MVPVCFHKQTLELFSSLPDIAEGFFAITEENDEVTLKEHADSFSDLGLSDDDDNTNSPAVKPIQCSVVAAVSQQLLECNSSRKKKLAIHICNYCQKHSDRMHQCKYCKQYVHNLCCQPYAQDMYR